MSMEQLLSAHLKSVKTKGFAADFQFLDSLREQARAAELKLISQKCDLTKYFTSDAESILSYRSKYSTEGIVSALLVDIDLDIEGIDVMAWCQYCNHLAFPPYFKLMDGDRAVRWYKRGRRPAGLSGSEVEEISLFSFDDVIIEKDYEGDTSNLLLVERKLFNAMIDIDSERVLKSIIDGLPLGTTKEYLAVLKLYETTSVNCVVNS